MRRTVEALIARGVDSELAKHLAAQKLTVGNLKQKTKKELISLGLNEGQANDLLREPRPPIPLPTVVKVLHDNRWSCCVCRNGQKSVILHHIKPWAVSRDHSPENLAVLCMDHHNEAHTKRDLALNLDEPALFKLKEKWESKVKQSDTRLILDIASMRDSARWDYVNHRRLFEMARAQGVKFKNLRSYSQAFAAGVISEEGIILSTKERGDAREDLFYMYDFSGTLNLYEYTQDVVAATLKKLSIINVSDYMDRSLSALIRPDDLICFQGAHSFRRLKHNGGEPKYKGVGQDVVGVR